MSTAGLLNIGMLTIHRITSGPSRSYPASIVDMFLQHCAKTARDDIEQIL